MINFCLSLNEDVRLNFYFKLSLMWRLLKEDNNSSSVPCMRVIACMPLCTACKRACPHVHLYVPSGPQSTVSDASCPRYSWSHHQHISSLCKHNKSRGRPQVTYTVGGSMKVWFWLTQKQLSGHKDRHTGSSLFEPKQKKQKLQVWKLACCFVDHVIALHSLIRV